MWQPPHVRVHDVGVVAEKRIGMSQQVVTSDVCEESAWWDFFPPGGVPASTWWMLRTFLLGLEPEQRKILARKAVSFLVAVRGDHDDDIPVWFQEMAG